MEKVESDQQVKLPGVASLSETKRPVDAHPAYDIVVVCKMSLALLAAKDLVRGEIDVVCESHRGYLVNVVGRIDRKAEVARRKSKKRGTRF